MGTGKESLPPIRSESSGSVDFDARLDSDGRVDSALEGAIRRREIAAIVVDSDNGVALANAPGIEQLKLLAPQGMVRQGLPLPEDVARLADGLRDDLKRTGSTESSQLTLASGFCLRASLLGGQTKPYLLMLFEPASRLDERNLSRRELEVATLVLNGLSNREIASKLSLAPNTVEGHLKRIFTKMQVHTRAGLVAKMLGWPSEGRPDATA